MGSKRFKNKRGADVESAIEPCMHFLIPYLENDDDFSTSLKRKGTKKDFNFPKASGSVKMPEVDAYALPKAQNQRELEKRLRGTSQNMQRVCDNVAMATSTAEDEDPIFTMVFQKFQKTPANRVDGIFIGILSVINELAAQDASKKVETISSTSG
ncbi:hypothetical protein QAD02_002433 [Eretmocerus hayati]|uniref:Uncharacterized protein n=1 Tax=Eretmocerus hayati TaxID=131215 RepID=A0ACC2NJ70_9HYME|nr:hypothetical protein QAD02_002433 [Eretmocerus hayati]